MKTLRDTGEIEAIRQLCARLPTRPDVRIGAGDDCAVVSLPGTPDKELVLTSDPVIEGIHFAGGTDPRRIGHKALGRVLSDIAAMGAEPCWMLTNIVAPRGTSLDTVTEISRGAALLAERFHAAVVGGDLAEGPRLEVHAFGVGILPAGTARLRSGAFPGDLLFVTGTLGGSIAGKHLDFDPRIPEGRRLRDWASAMIDLSDGLATDLRHILKQSRVGACIRAESIPCSAAAHSIGDGLSALEHALFDGEDFELLFTLPPARATAFEAFWKNATPLPCTLLGTITDQVETLTMLHADDPPSDLDASGFEHFRKLHSSTKKDSP